MLLRNLACHGKTSIAALKGPQCQTCCTNFVNRWNASGGPGWRLRLHRAPMPSQARHIQVLRSAPVAMAKAEYKALSSQMGVDEPKGTEDDIHRAMVQLIEKASHFIYIENQFFVSSFGQIGGETGSCRQQRNTSMPTVEAIRTTRPN